MKRYISYFAVLLAVLLGAACSKDDSAAGSDNRTGVMAMTVSTRQTADTGEYDPLQHQTVYIYNVCVHEDCYKEIGSQAISYTTGVPAMVGAKMLCDGTWLKPGVWNMEQNDPDPFLKDLSQYGLPWQCEDVTGKVQV